MCINLFRNNNKKNINEEKASTVHVNANVPTPTTGIMTNVIFVPPKMMNHCYVKNVILTTYILNKLKWGQMYVTLTWFESNGFCFL